MSLSKNVEVMVGGKQWIRVDELHPGMAVAGLATPKAPIVGDWLMVKQVKVSKDQKVMKICSSPFQLKVTPDHLFETMNGTRRADELKIGDNLQHSNLWTDVTSISSDEGNEDVYDVVVDGPCFGIWTHGILTKPRD